MGNTHQFADFAKELQATCQDLLPACIVSTTWPVVPASGLTLAAFSTAGYVKDGVDLVYVAQEAHTVVLTGGDGNYWLALGQDTWTAVASWNRTAGTHYLWRQSATRPADVAGILTFSQLTVSGGNITAVTPASGVTLAEALRTQAALGTLATQHANAVNITGGQTLNLSGLSTGGGATTYLDGSVQVAQGLGIRMAPEGSAAIRMRYRHDSVSGIVMQPSDADTGSSQPVYFLNLSGTAVGSISTTGSETFYNTTSDTRLKHAVATLAGALDAVRALRPVRFRWNADDSADEGFLAHELQQVLPHAVTGEPDAVGANGEILPQQVDHSKLVVWLVGACQELAAQAQALTARLAAVEAAVAGASATG